MNFNKIILCLFLLPCSLIGFTQPSAEKSPVESDSIWVNSLLQQSKRYFTDSPAKAISLALQAKNLAEKIHYQSGEAYALKNIGITYYYQGNFIEALDFYHQSLRFFQSINDYVGISNIYNNIGVVYYDQSDDTKALENYLQSLKFAELSGDKLRILSALNNIGGVYSNRDSANDMALQYYEMALPICEELGKIDELGAICTNIGTIYLEKKENTKAMFYFNKALKAYRNPEDALDAYNSLGKLYTSEKKFDSALQNHNRALGIAEKLNIKLSIVKSLTGLGDVYIKKNDYRDAIVYYKKAEELASKINASHELKDLYQQMCMAYEKLL